MRRAALHAYVNNVKRRRHRRRGDVAFADNFNRPDQNLENDANWTRIGGSAGDIVVSSNRCALPTTGSASVYRCPDIGTADHFAEALWQSKEHAAGPFIACRLTDVNNFVGARWNNGTGVIQILKRVATTFTTIGSFTTVLVPGDRIRLECSGDTARVLQNGIEVIPPVSLAGTNGGVTFCGLVPRLIVVDPWVDNFAAGRL